VGSAVVSEEAAAPRAVSDELVRRSIGMILTQSRAGAVTAVGMGAMFGFVYVPAVGWTRYLAWYAVLVMAFAARQPFFHWLVRRRGETQRTLFIIASVAAATGWIAAAAFVLFAPDLSVADLGVMTIISVGWIAMALSVLAVQPRVYLAYVIACFVTVFLGWISHANGRELAIIGFSMTLGGMMLARLAGAVWSQLRDTVEAAEQNARLVTQLQQALENQREAQRARSRFLGAASHDLRQPVQALLFLSDIFRRTADPARRDSMALQIVRTGQSIDTMFRHLVDFAQIDAGTMKAVIQPMHLERLLTGAVSGFAEKCAAKGLGFVLRTDAVGMVSADPVLLERMLRNFLDNAWKYSQKGTITLRVWRNRGEAILSVEDEGVGMDADDLAQACNAFHRGRSASLAEAEGIGLGLAVCKHIADLMHAELVLQSRPGLGTRVMVRLPLAESTLQEVVTAGPSAALQGMTVAVLEDDRIARDALCAWLEDAGARVVQGGTLAQLQAALRQCVGAPELILADFRLAQGNGVAAIEALQAEYGPVPAVVISGEADLAEMELGIPMLQKPVLPERLLELLVRLVPPRPAAAAEGGSPH